MILNPIFRFNIRPIINTIKQIRNARPTVKLGKEKFQISIDVRQFKKDEIRVKALPEYVLIEGKQEKKTSQGFVIRKFVRKFKLPDGCSPDDMDSQLSPDGILTITAKRRSLEKELPIEKLIPITFAEKESKEEGEVPAKDDLCGKYSKNKPEDKKS